MEYSVCVEHLFKGRDLYESLETLGRAGIRNIEFLYWMNKDEERLLALREKYGFRYVGICPEPAGTMTDPAGRDVILRVLSEGIEAAKRLGCENLAIQSGDRTPGLSERTQYANMMDVLREAGAMAAEAGVVLLLEPKNYYQAPETFLGTSKMGAEIVRGVGSPNLRLLCDIYHMQLNEGNVTERMLECLDVIGHIHAAGVPERHEVYTGELNCGYILGRLTEAGYRGRIGLEYFAAEEPLAGILETETKYHLNR